MAILPPGVPKIFQLQPGETLSIVTDSASVCRYTQTITIANAGEQPAAAPISIAVSSSITVGPRGDVSRLLIDSVIGPGVNVTQNAAASVPDSGAPLDVMHLFGSGAPTAATGANGAQTASLYTDTTNAKLYINGGTKAVPSWRIVTSA
jgi:hypothetical protein